MFYGRSDKGKNAFDLSSGKPDILNLLNHPPERLISAQAEELPEKTGDSSDHFIFVDFVFKFLCRKIFLYYTGIL